jgi:predicted ATPase
VTYTLTAFPAQENILPMIKLEQIQLKGFKSIRDIDLELRHLNILIGANGAGKSNFIHFFRLMNKLVQQDLQFFVAQQGGIDCFLHFGRQVTDAIEIVLLFKSNHYVCRLVPDQTGQLIFKEEYCEWLTDLMDEPNRFKKQALASGGDKESGLSKKSIANQITDYLSDWQIYHFHDTSNTAKVKQSGSIHDNERLRPQAENLAAFLFSIQQTEQYRKIVQTIQRVAPFFQDFILKPEKTAPEHIRLRWKHRGTNDYFDANALSDGTLRFICLTTLLLQPSLPLLILLDEPELGLHPYAMQLLAGMMRSAAHQTQIIASSQSVTLANQFEWQDLLIIESVDNASQFKRLSEEQIKVWLDEYRIGDLWEKNLIGGNPSC